MESVGFKHFDARMMTQYSQTASKLLDKELWMVCNPFTYYVGQKYSDTQVPIELAYLTDGASVPRVLWGMIPPWGPYGQAAVVHDRLCETLQVIYKGMPQSISRKDADGILKEAMEVLGVSKFQRETIYAGVSAYREVMRVNKPNPDAKKSALETVFRMKLNKGITIP